MRLLVSIWAVLLGLITGCAPASTPAPIAFAPSVMPKLLATVYISPTPNDAEQQATQFAVRPTDTPPPVTAAATATIYVGVFLGEAEPLDDAGAIGNQDSAAFFGIPTPPDLGPAPCPLPPDGRFGTAWQQNLNAAAALACPAQPAIRYDGTTQVFERGVMYITPDGELWAVSTGGVSGGRFWYALQAPMIEQESIPAPEGLRAPAFGFGALWQGVPGVRDALGFARTDEQGIQFVIQLFQGGTLILDQSAGQVFVLVGAGDAGTAFGPY